MIVVTHASHSGSTTRTGQNLAERDGPVDVDPASVGQDTETVVNVLIKPAQKLPRELYRSLTWDRGKEMADHRRFTLATDIKVYFCDPRSPWQRGSNENANGLLRQYLPKGIDLSEYSQSKLNALARRLNERPRKTLLYETPAQRLHEAVASTG
jgi:IS30 family transposase